MLLDEMSKLYGNDTIFLQKLGRLVLVADAVLGGVMVYVMTTPDTPVTAFQAQKLRDNCLLGHATFGSAFAMHKDTRDLLNEPDVTFQKGMDGTFNMHFKSGLINIDRDAGEVYNYLVEEMKNDMVNFLDTYDSDSNDKDITEPHNKWWMRANTFMEAIKIRYPRIKVLLHRSSVGISVESREGFDLIINIDKVGCMIDHIPQFWDIYYDSSLTGIEYHPFVLRLPKGVLKPVSVK